MTPFKLDSILLIADADVEGFGYLMDVIVDVVIGEVDSAVEVSIVLDGVLPGDSHLEVVP